MAKKNFDNAPAAKIADEVAKISAEKANVTLIKNILNENLLDYTHNQEDIKDTADLENSIKEIGFTDPIEVTSFGMDEGKYMIVSGHRRRAAGVKCGMNTFPCIIKTFASYEEVNNYVLLANSQRDSAKDPLLFCKRYKMHEEYLKAAGVKKNLTAEIAKRLGISEQQAFRYNAMNKVAVSVWDMVQNEIVGMSSVLPLATFTLNEQAKIVVIFRECVAAGIDLTRETVKRIVDGYKDGKLTWAAIKNDNPVYNDSGLPLNSMIGYDPDKETKIVSDDEDSRNSEVNREFDMIADEADREDAARKAWQEKHTQENEKKDDFTDTINDESEPSGGEQGASESKSLKAGKDIQKSFERINTLFSNLYEFEDAEKAEAAIRTMETAIAVSIDEMFNISKEHNLQNIFKNLISEVKKKVKHY